jgi:hypothetical protein
MDEKRFDAWTRRQLGLGAGGLAASLLGVLGIEDADSASRRHAHKTKTKGKHNGKNKGKHKGKHNGGNKGKHNGNNNGNNNGELPTCKKAGTGGCKTSRPECCEGLSCQAVPGFGGVRCCADVGASCSRDQQCCSGVCSGGVCTVLS